MPQDMHEAETEAGHATPLKAVRRHCLSCCNGSSNEVKLCPAKSCPLWPFRHGHRPNAEDRAAVADRQLYPLERDLTGATFHGSALRAIRLRCIDCSGNAMSRSARANSGLAIRHPATCIHFGSAGTRNINRSDEWKRAAAERLARAHVAALPTKPIETPDLDARPGSEGVGARQMTAVGKSARRYRPKRARDHEQHTECEGRCAPSHR